jgi:ER membrane protein complex subunit 6
VISQLRPRPCLRNANFKLALSYQSPSSTTPRSACSRYILCPIVINSSFYQQSLSNLHSLTASIFGITVGVLGLESYQGFLLYFVLSIVTTSLYYVLQVAPDSIAEGRKPLDTGRYYHSALDFWTSGVFSGLSGFVLTWTLFYGLVRA